MACTVNHLQWVYVYNMSSQRIIRVMSEIVAHIPITSSSL